MLSNLNKKIALSHFFYFLFLPFNFDLHNFIFNVIERCAICRV